MAEQYQMEKTTLSQISSICVMLEEKFSCLICTDNFNHPVKLKCRHRYCRSCIERHIRTKTSSALDNVDTKSKAFCPECCSEKSQVTKRNLVDDLESAPLQTAVLNLARIFEASFGVDDLQQFQKHPASTREAPSPDDPKRRLDLSSFSMRPSTRSKSTAEYDVSKDQETKTTGSKRNSTKMGRPSLDSTEFWLQVVEEAKASNNNAQVARKYGISPTTVRNWRKNEDKLRNAPSEPQAGPSGVRSNPKGSKNDNELFKKPRTPKKSSEFGTKKPEKDISASSTSTKTKEKEKISPTEVPDGKTITENPQPETQNEKIIKNLNNVSVQSEQLMSQNNKIPKNDPPKLELQKEKSVSSEEGEEENLENDRIVQRENKSIEANPIIRSTKKSSLSSISRQTSSISHENDPPAENEISPKPRFPFKIGSHLRSQPPRVVKLNDSEQLDKNNGEEKLSTSMHFKFFKAGRLCPTKERNVVELENYSQIARKRRQSSENGCDEGDDNTGDEDVQPPPPKKTLLQISVEENVSISQNNVNEPETTISQIDTMLVESPKKLPRIIPHKSSRGFHSTISVESTNAIPSQNNDDEPENALMSQNDTMLEDDLGPVIQKDNETEEIYDSMIPSSLSATENLETETDNSEKGTEKSQETESETAEQVNERSDDDEGEEDLFPTTQSPVKSITFSRLKNRRTLKNEKLAKQPNEKSLNDNSLVGKLAENQVNLEENEIMIAEKVEEKSYNRDDDDLFPTTNSPMKMDTRSIRGSRSLIDEKFPEIFLKEKDESESMTSEQDKEKSIHNVNVEMCGDDNLVEILDEHEMKHMVLANSGLKLEDRQKFYDFTEKFNFGACRTSMEGNPKVTHLIVNHEEDMCGDRTMKFLQAISKRIWIIGIKWVQESLSCGKCLLPKHFEVKDIHNQPGPSRARTIGKKSRLFEGFEVCLKGYFPGVLKKEILRQFLVDEGANTCRSISFMEFSKKKNVIIVDTDADADNVVADAEREFKMYSVITVTKDWLIDCLSSFRILKIDGYTKIEITDEQVTRINKSFEA